jgi:hypothetical protein
MSTRHAIVVLIEKSTGPWRHAKHIEEVSTNQFAAYAFGVIGVLGGAGMAGARLWRKR